MQFLVFELRGNSSLDGLSIKTSKSTRDGLLLMVLGLTGVSNSRIIGEDFFLLLSSVSTEPSLNNAVLVRNLCYVSSCFCFMLVGVTEDQKSQICYSQVLGNFFMTR